MKRLLALLVCVMIFISLAACSNAPASSTPSQTLSETVSIPGMTGFPETASTGLAYAVNEDGETCTVTGMGTCKDLYVKIPSEIDGYDVTAIGDNAFYGKKELEGIFLGSSILRVGHYAFFGCDAMTQLILNDRLESIGEYAFACCKLLDRLEIPASVNTIDAWAFYGCTALQGVYISDLTQWLQISFGGIYANPLICAHKLYLADSLVEKVSVPEEITALGDWVFAGCTNLQQLQLHSGVTMLGERALMDCDGITQIAFAGSLEQWRSIEKAENWDFSMGRFTIQCEDGEIKI